MLRELKFCDDREYASRSVMSDSLQPNGLSPAWLLSPLDSPGKSTGMGSHSLLQGIFLTQGSNQVCCTAGRFFTISANREALLGSQWCQHNHDPNHHRGCDPIRRNNWRGKVISTRCNVKLQAKFLTYLGEIRKVFQRT